MRFLINFSYSGENFHGYQKQGNLRTVQGELERILSNINNSSVKVCGSGRTDKGVNAIHQMAHFDLKIDITCYKLKGALNRLLPDDIYIHEIEKVSDDFHARYMAKEKTYKYYINTGEYNPLHRNHVYQYSKPLNIRKMKHSIKYFIGEHDFTTFTCMEDKREDKIRKIFFANIECDGNLITITFTGNGFLKYQIRNMVGLLIRVGEDKEDQDIIPKLFDYKDRTKIGLTAPACGLTLFDVKYK